jgi:hypothetical protein
MSLEESTKNTLCEKDRVSMPLSPSWAAINFTNFSVCDKKNEFEEVVNVTGVKL